MQRLSMLCLASASCLLVGCNQPAVTLKAPASQASENTVRDWNAVAHRIESDMALLGLLPDYRQPEPADTSAPRAVFVRVQSPDSAFVRAVARELEGDILWMGGRVARTPVGATVVNLDVNVVRWGPRDKPPGLLGAVASIAALPAIVIGDSLPMSTWTAADAAAPTLAGVGLLSDGIVAAHAHDECGNRLGSDNSHERSCVDEAPGARVHPRG